MATLCGFRDATGALIDKGLVLYFPGPDSYTGEDVVELQAHGSPAALVALVGRCIELGARHAEPGEFTRRAYVSGRMDLAQAEAVADLIDASTRSGARAAMRSLSGEFSAAVQACVDLLTELRILVEADIDFPDEGLEGVGADALMGRTEVLAEKLLDLEDRGKRGSVLRRGFRLVLVGRPNVGKSSVLNRLLQEERAIVSAIAGTTRDSIRETVDICGLPVMLVDTAGMRDSTDELEVQGMCRTQSEIDVADCVALVCDAADGIGAEETDILMALPAEVPVLILENKIDLYRMVEGVSRSGEWTRVRISAMTGAGLELLEREICRTAGRDRADEDVFLARERHLTAIRQAVQHVEAAGRLNERIELCADELRLAQVALEAVVGRSVPDDLLGEIFSRFCIGK